MTLILELPPRVEEQLTAEAASKGLSVAKYAERLLCAKVTAEHKPKTGAELVAYWKRIGVIGSRPDIKDSSRHARKLRRRAETRTRDQ